jgi:hypothetical protein
MKSIKLYKVRTFVFVFTCSLTYLSAVSCKSKKEQFVDNILGWWKISEYIYFDQIDFTDETLLFITKDSCSTPLVSGMPLGSTEGNWDVIQLDPPMIQINCADTIFSGVWEIKNITRSKVSQHAQVIMSFELFQPTKSFFFYR